VHSHHVRAVGGLRGLGSSSLGHLTLRYCGKRGSGESAEMGAANAVAAALPAVSVDPSAQFCIGIPGIPRKGAKRLPVITADPCTDWV
jgi:hypothetical protein